MITGAPSSSVIIVGGAGFIGGHLVDRFLADPSVERVTVYDNFTSGREWHLAPHANDPRLSVTRSDVRDLHALAAAMFGHELVIHLASNPDIAKAMTDPTVDFREGTELTNNVVEAMRRSEVPRILYASGSGVYGELGEVEAFEDYGPLIPVSTYGASKLAGEGLISSYSYMFGLWGAAFRFANVVGPRQTHGVGFDFIRRLTADPTQLRILGDGHQSKSYIHVEDVIDAIFTVAAQPEPRFRAYNVATGDYITVTGIARLAIAALELDPTTVTLSYTGGDRGWKGDVPVVRLDTTRIRTTGWRCERSSEAALLASMTSMVADARSGRLT